MTDTAPAPVEEPLPDAMEFVHNGIIRFHFPTGDRDGEGNPTTRPVRVRRPFLGELKTIRLALDQVQDDLSGDANAAVLEANALQARATDLSDRLGREEIAADDYEAQRAEIRVADVKVARDLDRKREDASLEWWQLVFDKLSLDDVPDVMEWPAWILDARLPLRVLGHWRMVPSGPG